MEVLFPSMFSVGVEKQRFELVHTIFVIVNIESPLHRPIQSRVVRYQASNLDWMSEVFLHQVKLEIEDIDILEDRKGFEVALD